MAPEKRPGRECESSVSWELRDACSMPDPPGTEPAEAEGKRKVGGWLFQKRNLIIEAETKWLVDRRAIAGAIAWEALQDVQSPVRHSIMGVAGLSPRSVGPGKVHLSNWYSQSLIYALSNHLRMEFSTTVEQTEQAGYLAWAGITKSNLEEQLAKTPGSITCIAAIMRADADAARILGGYSEEATNWNPAVLAAWFHGKDLREIVRQYSSGGDQGQKRPPLDPGTVPMGVWVQANLSFLERSVGKPDQCYVLKPIPGAKGLAEWAKAYDAEIQKRLERMSRRHPG
jgi:hypothetical protein